MLTPLEIYNNNRVLSFPDFCSLMLIDPEDMRIDFDLIEYSYGRKRVRIIHIHNIRSIRWMIYHIEKRLLYSFPYESREYVQYKQLFEELKKQINKVVSLERKVFSPRHRRGIIW